MVVMAIIAITLTLAGPRIGAGLGRLELNTAARTIQNFIKTARLRAERTDAGQYIVLDKTRRSVALVGADLKLVREETLASSVEIEMPPDTAATALYVTPSGMIRGEAIRLHGRSGDIAVSLQ